MPDEYLIVMLALGFVVLFLAVVWAVRHRGRKLGGTLTVYRNGHIVHEVSLSGARFDLDPAHTGLTGHVTPQRSDAVGRSRIALSTAGHKRTVVLADGQGHQVGEVFVEYQDHRSRAVARIAPDQAPRPRRRAADSEPPPASAELGEPGVLGRHAQPGTQDGPSHHAGTEGELGAPTTPGGEQHHSNQAPHHEPHPNTAPDEPPAQPPQ